MLIAIIGAPARSLLLKEEIPGPLLSIIGYDTLEEVANYINAPNPALTLYALSTDNRRLDGMLDRSISGGVMLNGSRLHAALQGMAFGSIGASGMGDDHSHDRFRRFSHVRWAHRIGFINLFERAGPPWGTLAERMGHFLARRRHTRPSCHILTGVL